jgi:hypothetical protein
LERSLFVIILLGTKPQRFISLTKSRFAALVSPLLKDFLKDSAVLIDRAPQPVGNPP